MVDGKLWHKNLLLLLLFFGALKTEQEPNKNKPILLFCVSQPSHIFLCIGNECWDKEHERKCSSFREDLVRK